MRILIGHANYALPPYNTAQYDVECVRQSADRQRPPATIAEMLEQCPPGWKPDVYYHASSVHFPIPTDILEFDGLTATDIQDWHRGGRAVWAASGFFDMILAERRSGDLLRAGGYQNAPFVRLWGINPTVHRILPNVQRDIDVLFIGSLNEVVWEERNRWVERLARLSDRHRVVIAMGHYGEDYVRLTNRAKIVFNRSVNGCTNLRAYDGLACGALVFNEEENMETQEIFQDRVHCVYYNAANFEALVDYYLSHEAERWNIVETGRQLVLAEHTETAHTNALFALLESNLDKKGYRPHAQLPPAERKFRMAMQRFSSAQPVAAETALPLLDQAEQEGFEPGRILEARAALQGWVAHYLQGADKIALLTTALKSARLAVRALPENALAQMTLAFLLLERAEATQGAHPTERNDIVTAAVALSTAAEICEKRLAANDNTSCADVEGFGYPRWSDAFDIALERAYLARDIEAVEWAREMRANIAWRCRSMLSDLAQANNQLEEAQRQAEAALQDLPQNGEALLRLARCEARSGDLELALAHYAQGIALRPFVLDAWAEITVVLVAMGRRAEAEAFVQDREPLIRAAPMFAAIRPALAAALASQS